MRRKLNRNILQVRQSDCANKTIEDSKGFLNLYICIYTNSDIRYYSFVTPIDAPIVVPIVTLFGP